MAFDPNRPFNDLPDLPPAWNTETRAILLRHGDAAAHQERCLCA